MIYSFNATNFNKVEPKLVLETTYSKEIRISMESGSIMKEHKAPGAIMVQVLKGYIEFEALGKIYDMKEFDLISLDADIPHSLKAKEDSIIRLSLFKNDSFDRVKTVEIG